MTPLTHAKNSVKLHGGTVDDYLPLHMWFDQTKLHVADLRHRVILHNSFGIGLCEERFGPYLTNSEGKKVPTRKLAEQHVIEDIGFIPSPEIGDGTGYGDGYGDGNQYDFVCVRRTK